MEKIGGGCGCAISGAYAGGAGGGLTGASGRYYSPICKFYLYLSDDFASIMRTLMNLCV